MEQENNMLIVQTIADELLPKLVALLQDIAPEYRERTIRAAMILVSGENQP